MFKHHNASIRNLVCVFGMEGCHLLMYSTSYNSSPFAVSKQIQSIDPMIVSVHNVFENSTPHSFGYCWNVRTVCIQSEKHNFTALQNECDASLEIMKDLAHGYRTPIVHCVILQHCYEMMGRKLYWQRASLHAVKHFWMYLISSVFLWFCLLKMNQWCSLRIIRAKLHFKASSLIVVAGRNGHAAMCSTWI